MALVSTVILDFGSLRGSLSYLSSENVHVFSNGSSFTTTGLLLVAPKLYEYKTSVKQTVNVFYNKAASQTGKQC
jgi:hypothetical protein